MGGSLTEKGFRPALYYKATAQAKHPTRFTHTHTKVGGSLQCLYLNNCSFHPVPVFCCLRSLITKLELFMVRITGDELCCLLSGSPALEHITLSFHFAGNIKVHASLGEALQVKNLHMNCTVFGCDTRAELASSMPSREMVNSPMVSRKLANLSSTSISLGELDFGRNFDCSSLVSIFGASLTLDT